MSDIDIENDQSIIDNTQLTPTGKGGYYTMHVELPNGHKINHTELTLEDARKIMPKWCEYVRTEWRSYEAQEQERMTRKIAEKAREREAERAGEITPQREAELRAKLPTSERARDEQRGNSLVKPKPRIIVPGADAPTPAAAEPVYVREQSQDPLAYAKQQFVYWTEEETKLEHASKMRAKWERVLSVLRDETSAEEADRG